MLTQIVASDSMDVVFSDLHRVSSLWNLAIECGCPDHPFPEIPVNIDFDLKFELFLIRWQYIC